MGGDKEPTKEDTDLEQLTITLAQDPKVILILRHVKYCINGEAGEEDLAVDMVDGQHRYVELKNSLCPENVAKAMKQFRRYYRTHRGDVLCYLATPEIDGSYRLEPFPRNYFSDPRPRPRD